MCKFSTTKVLVSLEKSLAPEQILILVLLVSVPNTETWFWSQTVVREGGAKILQKNLHVMHILYHNVSLNKKCIALKVATPFIDKKIAAAVTLQIYNWQLSLLIKVLHCLYDIGRRSYHSTHRLTSNTVIPEQKHVSISDTPCCFEK